MIHNKKTYSDRLQSMLDKSADLMKSMSEEERVSFIRKMEIGAKVMEEEYEVLKRLAE